jgi:hypothetical protein
VTPVTGHGASGASAPTVRSGHASQAAQSNLAGGGTQVSGGQVSGAHGIQSPAPRQPTVPGAPDSTPAPAAPSGGNGDGAVPASGSGSGAIGAASHYTLAAAQLVSMRLAKQAGAVPVWRSVLPEVSPA